MGYGTCGRKRLLHTEICFGTGAGKVGNPRIRFQYDHFTHAVRRNLEASFRDRWIGTGGVGEGCRVLQLGIFFWGRLKILIYETRVARKEDLAAIKIFSTFQVQCFSGKRQEHDASPLRCLQWRQRPTPRTALPNQIKIMQIETP